MFQLKRTVYPLLILAVLASAVSAPAATYYVATNGNDESATPTNINTPWRTVTKAVNAMVAGDTTYVRGGTYTEAGLIWFRNSGTQTAPIRLLNYPNESPIIRWSAIASTNRIQISSSRGQNVPIGWIVVEGFEITNGWQGFKILSVHDVIIRRNNIHDTLGGIGGYGIRVTVDRNLIYRNGRFAECAVNPKTCNQDHGMYVWGSDWIITNNIVNGNLGYGIHVAGYPYNTAEYPPLASGGADYAGARRFIIANNTVAFSAYAAGIALWQPQTVNMLVENNILYENSQNHTGASAGIDCVSSGTGHQFRNNLFFATTPGSTLRTSLCSGKATETSWINANPLFVNAGAADFRLQAESSAIKAGYPEPLVTTDFTGAVRRQDGTNDVGAYEYGGPVDETPPMAPVNLKVQ